MQRNPGTEVPGSSGGYTTVYNGSLERPVNANRAVHFTLKYRLEGQHWQWINDTDPQPDGEIYFQPEHFPSPRISLYFDCSGAGWEAHQISGSTSNGGLWRVERGIPPVKSNEPTFLTAELGVPRDFVRWLTLKERSTPWTGPRHGNGGVFAPDQPAALAAFLRNDGFHLVMLAVNGAPYVNTSFGHDGNGRIVVHSKNEGSKWGKVYILIAVARSFESADTTISDYERELLEGQARNRRVEEEKGTLY